MNKVCAVTFALFATGVIFFHMPPVQAKDTMVIFHPPSPSEIPSMRAFALKDDDVNIVVKKGYLHDLDKRLWIAPVDLCGGEKSIVMIVRSEIECGWYGCVVLGFRNGDEILQAGPANWKAGSSNVFILSRTHLGCHDVRIGPDIWTWRGKKYQYDARESFVWDSRKSRR